MGTRLLKIVTGAALLYYAILRGARGLVVGVKSYSFRGIDLNNGTVSFFLNILVKNPLVVGLTLKGVKGNVYIQGQNVGQVNTRYDYYLSGGHTHIIPVIVNLQLAGLGQAAILNIQSGDVRTLTIGFDGKLFIGDYNIGVPLQLTLDYNDLVK